MLEVRNWGGIVNDTQEAHLTTHSLIVSPPQGSQLHPVALQLRRQLMQDFEELSVRHLLVMEEGSAPQPPSSCP